MKYQGEPWMPLDIFFIKNAFYAKAKKRFLHIFPIYSCFFDKAHTSILSNHTNKKFIVKNS